MKKTYILYNPGSGNGSGKQDAETLQALYPDAVPVDMTQIPRYSVFFEGIQPEDEIILCGGDGTLNRFVNDTQGVEIKNKIHYFACGSGNDFARDLGHKAYDTPGYPVSRYLTELPCVTVNGKKRCFSTMSDSGSTVTAVKLGTNYGKRTEKPPTRSPSTIPRLQ